MTSPMLLPSKTVRDSAQEGLLGQESETDALRLVDNVEHLVRDLLSQWKHPDDALERRHWPRVGFQKMIALFAFDHDQECPTGQPWLATGKDISLQGVSFTHIAPLPFTKVAIGFELPGGFSQFALTRLSWCRFTRRGVYESGGTFLRPIEVPEEVLLDWDNLQRI